jgi:hypothetical protein
MLLFSLISLLSSIININANKINKAWLQDHLTEKLVTIQPMSAPQYLFGACYVSA